MASKRLISIFQKYFAALQYIEVYLQYGELFKNLQKNYELPY